MRRVNLNAFSGSREYILAEDIIVEDGIMIVPKDTAINKYIKKMLCEMGIFEIIVYNKIEDYLLLSDGEALTILKENYMKDILSYKEVFENLTAGKKLDYMKLSQVSKSIYEDINKNGSIIRCLNEIQQFDEYTYTHSVNTAFYSMLIAKWIKLPEQSIKEVIESGLLHDIGKIKIASELLNKHGKLTTEEFQIIKKHSAYGFEIVKDMDNINYKVKNAILMHHEKMDGSGYPLGVGNLDIDVYAKIISIADVYDAITSDRSYKNKATPFNAFEFFLTVGMGMFDITILKVFLNNIAIYYIGFKVTLSNGQIGEIVYIPPQDILNPIIKINDDYVDMSKESELKILSIGE